MKTHEQQSLDDQQRQGGKKPSRAPETGPDSVAGSIRELQATAGNRAVSDLVTGNRPTVQGSFFGGAFGGLEDWMTKDSPAASAGFDASMKQDSGDASIKEQSSDYSMKAESGDASIKEQSSDYSMKEEPGDASIKEQSSDYSAKEEPGDGTMKADDASAKWDGSQNTDASDKWNPPQQLDGWGKWDASQKLDASDKSDASEKSEPDLASKDDAQESEFEEVRW